MPVGITPLEAKIACWSHYILTLNITLGKDIRNASTMYICIANYFGKMKVALHVNRNYYDVCCKFIRGKKIRNNILEYLNRNA